MFLYPLPATWNYVRFKNRKTPNELEEKPSPKKDKLAIWNQMYFIASMSLYCERQNIRSLGGLPRKVYLYDVTESGARDMELDAFYTFHLSQAQFEKTPKSVIAHRVHYFEYGAIVRMYKRFEVANGSKTEGDIMFMRIQEFVTSLQFLPRCDSHTSASYLNKPVTLYECLNVAGQSEAQEYRGFASDWLQLMSWWRLANLRLRDASHQTRQLLRVWKNRPSSHMLSKISESADELDALMATLDLHHGSAELAAIRQCVPLGKNIPDSRVFVPSYECNLGTPKDNLFCNISEDCRLIALVVGCSYHNIHICFLIQRVIAAKLDDSDLFENIATTLKPLALELFFEVICPLRIGVKYNYIASVMEGFEENFKEYVLTMKRTRDENEAVDDPLRHAIYVWIEGEVQVIVTNSIRQLVLDVLQNGVLLAHKVLQSDFVTEDLLLEIATHQLKAHNEGLFEISCAQVAFSLISAYKIMHNGRPPPEGCFWLQDFSQREFVAFIDALRATCGLQQLDTESTWLRHELQQVQRCLSDSLRDQLHDLTLLARRGSQLLHKAKCLGKSNSS